MQWGRWLSRAQRIHLLGRLRTFRLYLCLSFRIMPPRYPHCTPAPWLQRCRLTAVQKRRTQPEAANTGISIFHSCNLYTTESWQRRGLPRILVAPYLNISTGSSKPLSVCSAGTLSFTLRLQGSWMGTAGWGRPGGCVKQGFISPVKERFQKQRSQATEGLYSCGITFQAEHIWICWSLCWATFIGVDLCCIRIPEGRYTQPGRIRCPQEALVLHWSKEGEGSLSSPVAFLQSQMPSFHPTCIAVPWAQLSFAPDFSSTAMGREVAGHESQDNLCCVHSLTIFTCRCNPGLNADQWTQPLRLVEAALLGPILANLASWGS